MQVAGSCGRDGPQLTPLFPRLVEKAQIGHLVASDVFKQEIPQHPESDDDTLSLCTCMHADLLASLFHLRAHSRSLAFTVVEHAVCILSANG